MKTIIKLVFASAFLISHSVIAQNGAKDKVGEPAKAAPPVTSTGSTTSTGVATSPKTTQGTAAPAQKGTAKPAGSSQSQTNPPKKMAIKEQGVLKSNSTTQGSAGTPQGSAK